MTILDRFTSDSSSRKPGDDEEYCSLCNCITNVYTQHLTHNSNLATVCYKCEITFKKHMPHKKSDLMSDFLALGFEIKYIRDFLGNVHIDFQRERVEYPHLIEDGYAKLVNKTREVTEKGNSVLRLLDKLR